MPRWEKIVERKGQSILISSLFYDGIQSAYFRKALDFPIGLDHYLIVKYTNYYDRDEVDRFKAAFASRMHETHNGFLKDALDSLYVLGQKVEQNGRTAGGLDALAAFERFSNACLEFGPAMYFPILAEEFVETNIESLIEKHGQKPGQFFEILTTPCKPTDGSNEILNVHKIAHQIKNRASRSTIDRLAESHLETYGWLSYTKFVGAPWTVDSIILRAGELITKDLPVEIERLESAYADNEAQTRQAVEKLGLSAEEERLVWLAKELAYFRTYRLDVYTKAGFRMRPVFAELAKRLGLSDREFVFLTYAEILDYAKRGETFSSQITRRRLEGDWQMKFWHGEMTISNSDFEVGEYRESSLGQIRGRSAMPGKAVGTVRIVRGVPEFSKMKSGDVLVTSMTTPDFVPLMQKAVAIITDEGGITCHAAIVSRELKVPCVVGTGNATLALKDGDHVEVDATNGIVRKMGQTR